MNHADTKKEQNLSEIVKLRVVSFFLTFVPTEHFFTWNVKPQLILDFTKKKKKEVKVSSCQIVFVLLRFLNMSTPLTVSSVNYLSTKLWLWSLSLKKGNSRVPNSWRTVFKVRNTQQHRKKKTSGKSVFLNEQFHAPCFLFGFSHEEFSLVNLTVWWIHTLRIHSLNASFIQFITELNLHWKKKTLKSKQV